MVGSFDLYSRSREETGLCFGFPQVPKTLVKMLRIFVAYGSCVWLRQYRSRPLTAETFGTSRYPEAKSLRVSVPRHRLLHPDTVLCSGSSRYSSVNTSARQHMLNDPRTGIGVVSNTQDRMLRVYNSGWSGCTREVW